MKLFFESDILLPNMTKEIELLTRGAWVHVTNIIYDKDRRSVNILFERNAFTGYKTSLFGNMKPRYERGKLIDCVVKINNVNKYELTVESDIDEEEFKVHIGLGIEEKKIYMRSSSEPGLELLIGIDSISISIEDINGEEFIKDSETSK